MQKQNISKLVLSVYIMIFFFSLIKLVAIFFTFFCQICRTIFFIMYVLALKAVICILGQHYMHAELGHVVDPV